MTEPDMSEPSQTIRAIGDQLSRVFRHLLPGIVIVGGAAAAHPSWFLKIDPSEPWHLLVLSAITVGVGNCWYVLHRYSLHQLLDFVLYSVRSDKRLGYIEWLADFLHKSFLFKAKEPEFWKHIHFRSSQVILMFIIAEVMLVFALSNEPGSFLAQNVCGALTMGSVVFVAACFQYWISNTLDTKAVEAYGKTE